MKTYRLLPSLSALVLLINLSSCEKIFMVEDISDDAQTVFEHLWQDAHERYSYFEFKEIDWHEVKNRYEERIYDGMPEKELFNVLAEMLFELEDGHVNLTSSFDRSRNWDWFQNYPLDYNQGIIDRNYLGRDFRITGPFQPGYRFRFVCKLPVFYRTNIRCPHGSIDGTGSGSEGRHY